jgi:hypothetical protein
MISSVLIFWHEFIWHLKFAFLLKSVINFSCRTAVGKQNIELYKNCSFADWWGERSVLSMRGVTSSGNSTTNFTFMWPCNVTNFFIMKPTRCTNSPNPCWHETLHVSVTSSAHHQEFIHCTIGIGYRKIYYVHDHVCVCVCVYIAVRLLMVGLQQCNHNK